MAFRFKGPGRGSQTEAGEAHGAGRVRWTRLTRLWGRHGGRSPVEPQETDPPTQPLLMMDIASACNMELMELAWEMVLMQ